MKAPRRSADAPHDEHGADTVEGFASRHAISRAQAFKEVAEGRLIARKVGSRTIITIEDAAAWRRALPKKIVNRAPHIRDAGPNRPGNKTKTRDAARGSRAQT